MELDQFERLSLRGQHRVLRAAADYRENLPCREWHYGPPIWIETGVGCSVHNHRDLEQCCREHTGRSE